MLKVLSYMLPLSGISSTLTIALVSSWDGSINLFFFGVSCAFAFNAVISSSVIAYLLPFLDFRCCFFCGI